MGLTQASPLVVVLLSVYLSNLVSGRPTILPEPQPVCNVNKLSAYFLEMYKLYSMQAELKAIQCNKDFNGQPINPAFCECDSVSGKQAEPQGEPGTATGASAVILFLESGRCCQIPLKKLQKGVTFLVQVRAHTNIKTQLRSLHRSTPK